MQKESPYYYEFSIMFCFYQQGAAWDPDGHMILIAFSESITLASIHFASKPPSLGILSCSMGCLFSILLRVWAANVSQLPIKLKYL